MIVLSVLIYRTEIVLTMFILRTEIVFTVLIFIIEIVPTVLAYCTGLLYWSLSLFLQSFAGLVHLEVEKTDVSCIEGWGVLKQQLRTLVFRYDIFLV
jgi:hypothetical protein